MFHFIIAVLFSTIGFAQIESILSFDYQQNPPGLEWKKIDTEHFEVIFPKEIEAEAQRAAHLLEKVYPYVCQSLEVYPPKISLILQNQSVVSNGFVTLAPRRSEWYVTPSIDPELTNTEWIKTLAIHEFRHIVQFQKTRQRINRVYEFLFGEVGQAIGLGISLPPWFLEGDAVGIETAMTQGGRGRLPLFERDLRALLLSGKKFDYDKTHLGSYEDYIPNHYVFGYFYTTFMRNYHGDMFLSKIADESTSSSYNLLTFYNSYEALTGEKFEDFYESVMKDLIKDWSDKLAKQEVTPYEVKNLNKRFGWTNYSYPQMTSDNKVFALKRGLSFINQFVLLDGKKEKTLFYPGSLFTEYPFKLRNDRVAYLELDIDPRWGYRNYSRLKVYDLTEKKHIVDIRKKKWRLAVLDHQGENILLVDWDEKQGQFINVINQKGKTLFKFPYPKNKVITSIDWLNNGEIVLVVKDHQDLKSIVKMSLLNQEESILFGPSLTNIGFVSVSQEKIFLESPESGIDNIFILENQTLKQLTSSRFGAYAPVLHNNELIYNDYTAEGMDVVVKKMDWADEQKSSDSFIHFYEKFAQKESKLDFSEAQTPYEVSQYSQVKNSINPHSWFILAPPLSSSVILAALSRDVLNKFTLSFGGEYNLNEKTSEAFVAAAWSHYYPVIDLSASYGTRIQDIPNTDRENKWEEGVAQLGLQVPWKSIVGRFSQNFTLRSFAKVIKVTNKISRDITEVNDGALFSPGAEFSFSYLSRFAQRDINPSLGFNLSGHFEEGRDFTGVDQKGSLRSFDSRIFLPGLGHHHSFYHQVAYERQLDDFYQYSSLVLYPRGTRRFFLDEFVKYSGNYTLPLFYPDWHWSRYVNFRRVAANLFYDSLSGRFRNIDYQASSAGWETLFEMNFFRLAFPITLGLRGSYPIEGIEKEENYEFFITTFSGSF